MPPALPRQLWLCWVAVGLFAAAVGAGRAEPLAAQETRGTLVWLNGDRLPGVLLRAGDGVLHWQSDVFNVPFQLDLAALRAIERSSPRRPVRSEQPFRVVTVTNDVLLGQLIDISDDQIVFSSPRLGRVRLERSQLIGVQRQNRKRVGSVGLGLLADWRTLHRGREIGEWERGVDGRIVTKVTGAELYRDLHLTALSEIELAISWTGEPGFMISFADPDSMRLSKQVVKLETWEKDLVLQTLGANGDFEVIRTIPDEEQSLELRLRWNPVSGDMSVHTIAGQLLGKMGCRPAPGEDLSGVYIQNKGPALNLLRLNADGWEGAGTELAAGSVRLRLADAEPEMGRVSAFNAETGVLSLETAGGATRRVGWDQVNGIDFGHDIESSEQPPPVRVTFHDGAQLSGLLESVSEGVIHVRTRYSEDPIGARLDGVLAIRFAAAEDPPRGSSTDVIELAESKLHGRLVGISDQQHALGWQPVGSRNAAPLPGDVPLRITLARDQVAGAGEARFLDRIFLRNGDAVPCTIRRIDDTHLLVDVPLSDRGRIAREHAVAVEFGTLGSTNSHSFLDPEWEIVGDAKDESVERTEQALVVHRNATIAFRDMRDANEIAFDIGWNTSAPALVRLELFTGEGRGMGQSPGVMVYQTNGTRVMLQALQQGRAVRAVAPIQVRDGRSEFRFRIRNRNVTVFERDRQVLELAVPKRFQRGKRLSISVQPLNVNNIKRDAENPLLTLENPIIRRSSGDVVNVLADQAELARLLTVPRFRKQSPPTEVLVGQNGDLLRGRLLELNDQRAKFVTRLEEISVPRERLAGIVWLREPEEAERDERKQAQLTRILFTDGSVVRMELAKMLDDALVGQHPALGNMAVPVFSTREVSMGGTLQPQQRNPFADWILQPAAEPRFATNQPGADGEPGSSSPLVSGAAPAFTTELLDGERFELSSQKGRVVVLDFWATWCGPCVRSMPHTIDTVGRFPAEQVALVTINQMETADTIRSFLDAHDWDLTVALDQDGQIGKLYQVQAIPQLVVIDPSGIVRHVFVGDRGDLHEQLEKLLRELTGSEDPASQ